jgi:response regulator RpfG family c-di-GMP phosphodiesterase
MQLTPNIATGGGSRKLNILLVDDQPAKLLSLQAVLAGMGETLISASSAKEAFECLLKNEIALILIDVCMPDLDGFELAGMIREHPRFQQIGIIFVSAIMVDHPDQLRGYELGAIDYVPVPVVPELLRAKVKVFLDLYRKSRQLERLNAELEQRTREREAVFAQLVESQKNGYHRAVDRRGRSRFQQPADGNFRQPHPFAKAFTRNFRSPAAAAKRP